MTDTLTAEQRASKVAKITALLAKTMARGCTAEEEASALALAGKLMTQYSIRREECEPKQQPRRPAPSPTSWMDDLLSEALKRDVAEMRAEAARAAYRQAGVHVDRDAQGEQVHHPDCQCPGCREYYRRANAAREEARARARTFRQQSAAYEHMGYSGPGGIFDEADFTPPRTEPGRRNTSHKGCDHEATPTARARCRKSRGF